MKITKILKENKIYLTLIFVLFFIVWIINNYYLEELTTFDKNILNFINVNIQTSFMTAFMKAVSLLGSAFTYIILLFLFIVIGKDKKFFSLLTCNFIFISLLNFILKIIYMRVRPETALIRETGFSLPSFHAMCSIAFYGFLIYSMKKYIPNIKIRYIFTIFFAILILLIGFSRIYLNVHYMSDVIIGYLFGLLFMLIFIKVIEKGEIK